MKDCIVFYRYNKNPIEAIWVSDGNEWINTNLSEPYIIIKYSKNSKNCLLYKDDCHIEFFFNKNIYKSNNNTCRILGRSIFGVENKSYSYQYMYKIGIILYEYYTANNKLIAYNVLVDNEKLILYHDDLEILYA